MSNESKGFPWMYFGCRTGGGAGHYLQIKDRPQGFGHTEQRIFDTFDGKLAPRAPLHDPFKVTTHFEAALTRFGGMGISALSWWDPTVDKRPGSNVIVFAPSIHASPETIYFGFLTFFPREESRFRRVPVEDSVLKVPREEVVDRRVWIPSVNYGRSYFRDENNALQEPKAQSTI